MWWLLAGMALAGLIGLEARRLRHNRAEEARGVRRYALYGGRGQRALRLIEIDGDGSIRPVGDPGGLAVRDAAIDAQAAPGGWTAPRDVHHQPARVMTGTAPARRRSRRSRQGLA